jgi:hypothetical protein
MSTYHSLDKQNDVLSNIIHIVMLARLVSLIFLDSSSATHMWNEPSKTGAMGGYADMVSTVVSSKSHDESQCGDGFRKRQ